MFKSRIAAVGRRNSRYVLFDGATGPTPESTWRGAEALRRGGPHSPQHGTRQEATRPAGCTSSFTKCFTWSSRRIVNDSSAFWISITPAGGKQGLSSMNFPWALRVGASRPSGQPNLLWQVLGAGSIRTCLGCTVRFQTVERPGCDLGRTCNHAVTAAPSDRSVMAKCLMFHGGPGRTRTSDQRFRKGGIQPLLGFAAVHRNAPESAPVDRRNRLLRAGANERPRSGVNHLGAAARQETATTR